MFGLDSPNPAASLGVGDPKQADHASKGARNVGGTKTLTKKYQNPFTRGSADSV